MNILLMLAHSIAEYDDLRMLSSLGHNVFSIGAYIDPANPADDKRPALPDVPAFPELAAYVGDQLAAKESLPDPIIDWADTIIVHHYLREWVYAQWDRIRHKRVVWRTCGQSDIPLEDLMTELRRDGLQIVRYSPAEERFFAGTRHWAGQDALIRFGKYPDEWDGWVGSRSVVANVTQNMPGRGAHVGRDFYLEATHELSAEPAGPNSEHLPGGLGAIGYEELRRYLRGARAYLYTGTVPAPYTLGLIEALLTGIPVVSMDCSAWAGPRELFEGCELAPLKAKTPEQARDQLRNLMRDYDLAREISEEQRPRAVELFDVATVAEQWRAFLG